MLFFCLVSCNKDSLQSNDIKTYTYEYHGVKYNISKTGPTSYAVYYLGKRMSIEEIGDRVYRSPEHQISVDINKAIAYRSASQYSENAYHSVSSIVEGIGFDNSLAEEKSLWCTAGCLASAAVMSQADSPLPGPADVAAVVYAIACIKSC